MFGDPALEEGPEDRHGKVNLRLAFLHGGDPRSDDVLREVGERPHGPGLFQNLISNALKFHKPDTAPVVEIVAKSVNMAQYPWGAFEIQVSDNGIGFDEKYLDRIFTIFQRLHGRFEYEGTGIGLAVCRKIIYRHGGQLTAKSLPEQGATFIITLPKRQKLESENETAK